MGVLVTGLSKGRASHGAVQGACQSRDCSRGVLVTGPAIHGAVHGACCSEGCSRGGVVNLGVDHMAFAFL